MSALLALLAGALLTCVAVYYGLFRAARCTWSGTLAGKTAIVTGNSYDICDFTVLIRSALQTNLNSREVKCICGFESNLKLFFFPDLCFVCALCIKAL